MRMTDRGSNIIDAQALENTDGRFSPKRLLLLNEE
jgi:hypothetical protein